MKKKLTTNMIYGGSITLAVVAVGAAGNIEHAADGWGMLGWFCASIGLMVAALIVAALGVVSEQEDEKKIHRKPRDTVQPKSTRRKGA